MKDALAIIALIAWLGANVWLWILDISLEARFVRSSILGIIGFAGIFGYLAYRNRAQD